MARPFDKLTPRVTRLGPEPSSARRELFFMHGAWHGSSCWGPLAEPLAAEGYGVNLLDLPGHGDQKWDLPPATSIEDYAAIAGRAADRLGSPVLIGHSMGGWILQKLLEERDLPSVLLCPLPAKGLAIHRTTALILRYPAALGIFIGRPFRIKDPAMARRLFHDRIDENELAARWAELCPEPARAARQMGLNLCWAHPKRGSAPRLVIAVEDDYFMPLGAERRLARRLGARLEVLPGLPHNPWLEDEDGVVLGLLKGFLADLEG